MQNPWLDFASYQYSDRNRFKGREEDIAKFNLIMANGTMSVLYADSGIGKTSFINAGIGPIFIDKGYFPIHILFNEDTFNSNIDVEKWLISDIESKFYEVINDSGKEVKKQIKDWHYLYSDEYTEINKLSNSLWWRLHAYKIKDLNNDNTLKPLLVFDQFEEVFIKGKKDFLSSLFSVIEQTSSSSLPDSVSNALDELEEFEDLEIDRHLDFKILFSLRKDYLSDFDYWCNDKYSITELFQNRMLLNALSRKQANQVICDQDGVDTLDDVADEIIEKIDDKHHDAVEPFILSVFCSRLYEKAISINKEILKKEDLAQIDIKNIIRSFYEEKILSLISNEAHRITFETTLVDEDGFRKRERIASRNLSVIGFEKTYAKPLEDSHLIRIVTINDAKCVEIVHDRIAEVISERNKQRENQKKIEEIQKEQERLIDVAEQQRKEKNREYNRIQLLNSLNVLTVKGRSLIDNALDFGDLRTLTSPQGKKPIDLLLRMGEALGKVTCMFFDLNAEDENSQQVFYDSQLVDSTTFLSFSNNGKKISTSDGIYKVALKYSNKKIVEILFYGKTILNGVENYDSHIYIAGGYAGILIKYDESGREIQRTYVDEKKKPIACKDGYSVVTREYDEKGNPNKIRYYNYEAERLVPCLHSDGNHGFDSVFDECGNELYRLFVDTTNSPTTIISGVYGKGMSYDSQSFLRTSLCNIDSQKNIMQDKDGYAVEKYRYNDDNHLLSEELYYDKTGKPWTNHDGCHGNLYKIDYDANILRQYNLGIDGQIIEDCNGISSYECELSPTHNISAIRYYSLSGNLADNDGISEYHLDYDSCGRVNSFEMFSGQHIFKLGYSLEFNKEGTNILRVWNIGVDGEPVIDSDFGDEEHPVYGQECDRASNDNFSLLYFLSKEGKYIVCNDEYYAVAKWFDENADLQKELFFDKDGNPMPDKEGVFGHIIERVNEGETKQINIAPDGNLMEDGDGVCIIKSVKEAGESIVYTYFNKDNVQISLNDIWRNEVTTIKENNQTIECTRLYDKDNNLVNGTYQEEVKDSKQRLILRTTKDCVGQPVQNEGGYCSIKYDYSDDGLSKKSMFVDKEGNMVALYANEAYYKEEFDSFGRTISESVHDIEGNLLPMSFGQYTTRYEYRKENDVCVKITSFWGQDNELVDVQISEDEVAAIVELRFDKKGRLIGHKLLNKDKELQYGFHIIKEYISCSKDVSAYKLYALDENGISIPNPNWDGANCCYIEEDSDGRKTKELWFDVNNNPFADLEGDYGLSYEYGDNNLIIAKCLNENGEPHNNQLGYGIIHSYRDDNGNEIKKLFFTAEGEPTTYPELLGCYGQCFEYPDKNIKITGYLDRNGNITTNKYGYSYREEVNNSENVSGKVFYYDINRNNCQSTEDGKNEFGQAIAKEDEWKYIISLAKDGSITNNACGYAVKSELYENGLLRFYKFEDVNRKPIADNCGDYGTEIQRSDDGSMIRLISLDNKYEKHINDHGYCSCDIITDIVGDKVRLYRNLNGDQVLPKMRISKRIKSFFFNFMKKENALPIFNGRQIGAVYDCILGNIETNDLGKKSGLSGTYVLLQYDNWAIGDNNEDLNQLIIESKKQSKHLVLLPVFLNGSILKEVGEIVEIDFPKGQIGMRFKEWGINVDTIRVILEKKQEWENRVAQE